MMETTSLKDAHELGPGHAIAFDAPKTRIGMQIVTEGAADNTFTVQLEVSINGRDFSVSNIDANQRTSAEIFGFDVPPCVAARARLIKIGSGRVSVFIAAT